MIKAYPLIYSRTKNADFVPDFLVRPFDLDVKTTLKYVSSALANLDTFDGIRYSAFSVGDYCICGGISSINKLIVNGLKETGILSGSLLEEAVKYINDCKGRNMKSFIGFAIHKSDIRSGKIPDLKLSDYWAKYQEYIVHQWEDTDTKSEEIKFPPFEIPDKTYSSLHKPCIEKVQGKDIVVDFNKKPQETLEYFFDQILNKKVDVSFISDINYRSDWENLLFSHSHVSDSLYKTLTTAVSKTSVNSRSMREPEIKSVSSTSYSGYNSSTRNTKVPEIKTVSSESDYSSNNNAQKKTAYFNWLPILCIVLAVLILVILIVVLKPKTQTKAVYTMSNSSMTICKDVDITLTGHTMENHV